MNIDEETVEAFWRREGALGLEERVYQFLHERIVHGEAVPGSGIVGSRLAKDLGVSRITVTNVLRRLSSEGFVVVHPHRGATVASLDLATLNEILRIRYALESEVMTELALNLEADGLEKLRQLDERVRQSLHQNDTQGYRVWEKRFHLLVYELSGLPMIASFLTDLWNRIEPYRGRRYTSQLLVQEALDDHRRVLEALAARDTESAVAAMRAHIARGHNHLLHVFNDRPASEEDDAPAVVGSGSVPHLDSRQGPAPGSLQAAFATIPDSRRGQGRMYTQDAILTLAVCAMLCGARSQYAIAAWIQDAAPTIREAVGWPRERIPSPPTVHRVFSRIDPEAFGNILETWLCRQQFDIHPAGTVDRTSGVHGERPPGTDIVEILVAALHRYSPAHGTDRKSGDIRTDWERFFGHLLYGEQMPSARSRAEQQLWAAFHHVAGSEAS